MTVHSWLRLVALDAKATILVAGPAIGATALVGSAWGAVQEPSFFRQQGLDLAWPFSFALSHLLALCIGLISTSRYAASTSSRVAAGFGMLGCAMGSLGLALTLLVLFDQLVGAATPWPTLAPSVLAYLMVWLPIFLLASGTWWRGCSNLTRLLGLGVALTVQISILPASLGLEPLTLRQSMAGALSVAAAFGLVAATANHRSRS